MYQDALYIQFSFTVLIKIYTIFPQIITGVIISNFATKGGNYSKESDYSRKTITWNISRKSSCPICLVLLYQVIKEKMKYMNITIEKSVKKNGALVTIQLWTINESFFLPKISIFNFREMA